METYLKKYYSEFCTHMMFEEEPNDKESIPDDAERILKNNIDNKYNFKMDVLKEGVLIYRYEGEYNVRNVDVIIGIIQKEGKDTLVLRYRFSQGCSLDHSEKESEWMPLFNHMKSEGYPDYDDYCDIGDI